MTKIKESFRLAFQTWRLYRDFLNPRWTTPDAIEYIDEYMEQHPEKKPTRRLMRKLEREYHRNQRRTHRQGK